MPAGWRGVLRSVYLCMEAVTMCHKKNSIIGATNLTLGLLSLSLD